jgi:hypothetical protein
MTKGNGGQAFVTCTDQGVTQHAVARFTVRH